MLENNDGEKRRWRGEPVAVGAALIVLATLVARSEPTASTVSSGMGMGQAATVWIDSLDAAQKTRAVRPFADANRTDWHFVPKNDRKGVQLRDMTEPQRAAALALLRSALSEAGYEKSTGIMQLDELLRILEGARARNVRDPQRYYFTVFGTPADAGSWGLSVEGHHLSLNFTVRDGAIVDSTPQFLGANPAEVKTTFPGLPPAGHRILKEEETLAFALVAALDARQRQAAVVAADPPKEIRAAGAPQPPREPAVGIGCGDLTTEQQELLRRIIDVYCAAMVDEVAAERLRLIEAAGWEGVRFAWAGSLVPGVGHGYRIEGPTFVIEFVNIQPDAEGNPANHIHCVWRDKTGDFDLPAG